MFLLDLADDRDKLASSNGKLAQYLCKILGVYYSYHLDAYEIEGMFDNLFSAFKMVYTHLFFSLVGVYLHDPTTILAAFLPSLFTYTEGVVRVQTNGITRGLTLLYNNRKR